VVAGLARADGAVGWTVGQAALAQVVFTYLPMATVDEIYADGPDAVGAGAVAPKRRAQRSADGWRISGQGQFVTGCQHTQWFYGQCVVAGERPCPEAYCRERLAGFKVPPPE